MALNVGQITASLSLNISQFVGSLGQATKVAKSLGNELNSTFNNLGGAMNNANKALDKMKRDMREVDNIVSGILISQIFYNSARAIREATNSLVGFMNSMEKAQIAMEYFLGTPERAEGFILNMKDFAAETAFSVDQALTLSRRLMAAQFEPTAIRSIMEILHDASSATGGTAEQMDRIVLALTQMSTNGKIAGQEMRQLAEAGIPIYKILEEELGLVGEQLLNIGELQIDGDLGVQAVLRGLERRYKGAALRIADTLPGMWESISQNTLMLGEALLEGPYEALKRVIRVYRDGMEEARHIMIESGLGGVFERFIPPELHTEVRLVLASIQSLGESARRLYDALKPAGDLLARTFLGVMASVMPIVSATARAVSHLVSAALDAVPALKLFVAALGGFMIAGAAAKALTFLWTVTRMGVICSLVAASVMTLVRAIQALFIVLTRNPITGIIMVVAGALLYLATSTQVATKWLDALTARLSGLAGLDMSIFSPTEQKSLDEWTSEFNQRLAGMDDNLKDVANAAGGVGDAAKKAGKDVKDTFLAAFDEVYEVPDKLDAAAGALGDIGAAMDDLKMPELPPIPEIPSPSSVIPRTGLGTDDDDLDLPPVGRSPGGGFQPPNLAPVTAAIATVNSLISAMRANMANAFQTVGDYVGGIAVRVGEFAVNTGRTIADWVIDTSLNLATWGANSLQVMVDWSTGTAAVISGWVQDVTLRLGEWTIDGANAIVDWATGTAAAISNWGLETSQALAAWALESVSILANWAIQAGIAVSGWVVDTASSIWNWVVDTGGAIASWALDTGFNISTWAVNAAKAVSNWASDTAGEIGSWVTRTAASLTEWAGDAGSSISAWASSTYKELTAWASNAKETVTVWVANTKQSFTGWVTDTASAIANWGTQTTISFKTWSIETTAVVTGWTVDLLSAIRNWVDNTVSNLNAWSTSVLGIFTALGSSLVDSFTSTWDNMKSTASTAWANIKSFFEEHKVSLSILAGAIGVAIVAAFGGPAALGSIVATAGGIISRLPGVFSRITPQFQRAISNIPNVMRGIFDRLPSIAQGAVTSITNAFSGIGSRIRNAMGNVSGAISGAFNNIKLPTISLPTVRVPGYETGGIVDFDHLARIGEGGKREAIIPLENDTYMRPFSAAVANDLYNMMGGSQPRSSDSGQPVGNQTPQPILYVGNLIADERGLMELKRRMDVIALNDSPRSVRS